MFDFSLVTQWFDQLLRVTIGCPDWLAILIECVLVGAAILGGYALLAIVLIFMERKVCWSLGPAAGICRRFQDAYQGDFLC